MGAPPPQPWTGVLLALRAMHVSTLECRLGRRSCVRTCGRTWHHRRCSASRRAPNPLVQAKRFFSSGLHCCLDQSRYARICFHSSFSSDTITCNRQAGLSRAFFVRFVTLLLYMGAPPVVAETATSDESFQLPHASRQESRCEQNTQFEDFRATLRLALRQLRLTPTMESISMDRVLIHGIERNGIVRRGCRSGNTN
jgi:hypothetical protein